jgi:hypothetical protein
MKHLESADAEIVCGLERTYDRGPHGRLASVLYAKISRILSFCSYHCAEFGRNWKNNARYWTSKQCRQCRPKLSNIVAK